MYLNFKKDASNLNTEVLKITAYCYNAFKINPLKLK
ncbi:hypothetical protein SPPR111872_19255 [Sphingobacterium prati]